MFVDLPGTITRLKAAWHLRKGRVATLKSRRPRASIGSLLTHSSLAMRRVGRMAIAPVLKTGVRKGMGVRIPHSPPLHFKPNQIITHNSPIQIKRKSCAKTRHPQMPKTLPRKHRDAERDPWFLCVQAFPLWCRDSVAMLLRNCWKLSAAWRQSFLFMANAAP